MSNLKKIRTRFPPSPTGYLHVGGLRTALFSYLIAKKAGGDFILRIEDTDQTRVLAGSVENIIQTLKDFGLAFDEGPGKDGGYGPYIQSARLEIYHRRAQQLLEQGSAYKCFCTSARLEELRKAQAAQKSPPRYDGFCRALKPQEVNSRLWEKLPCVIRQKIPRAGVTVYDDLVHGRLQFRNALLDDAILIKSDGFPVYNFANVVDDHLMAITHVVRGEEFLSSTPKHVLLYRAFGWDLPKFIHLPLLLDANRKKLSKRMGDVAVADYVNKGYLKEALLNFVALLGWNPKTQREIFSLQALIKEFDISNINKSGAIFDVGKLDFLNREWQKRLKLNLSPKDDPIFKNSIAGIHADLKSKKVDIQPEYIEIVFEKVYPQFLERIKGPSDMAQNWREFYFYFIEPEYDPNLLIWQKMTKAQVKQNLMALRAFISGINESDFKSADLETKIKTFIAEKGMATGEALWPLRVALCGQKNSPSPFEIMEVFASVAGLRGAAILRRIDRAIELLQ